MRVASKVGNIPNKFGHGLWILELLAVYATDGQMDGWTDKSNAYCPFPTGGGIKMVTFLDHSVYRSLSYWRNFCPSGVAVYGSRLRR